CSSAVGCCCLLLLQAKEPSVTRRAIANKRRNISSLLKRACHCVILVGRQQEILANVHLNSVPFANCDRRRYVDEPVEDRCGTLEKTGRNSVFVCVRSISCQNASSIRHLRRAGDDPERNRAPENLHVVIVQ